MPERFVSFTFCDDIRQEVGNKYSLIGCYGPSIQVDPIPSVLPKLCALIKVYTPIERPLQSLSVRIIQSEKVIAELAFPAEAFAGPLPLSPQGARWLAVTAVFVMSPFAVDTPGVLRVEAETEKGTIVGGSVWLTSAVVSEPDRIVQ